MIFYNNSSTSIVYSMNFYSAEFKVSLDNSITSLVRDFVFGGIMGGICGIIMNNSPNNL